LEGLRAKPTGLGETLTFMIPEAVRVPDVPVTVTVLDAPLKTGLAVNVRTLAPVVGLGLNDAVVPSGNPDAARVTLPVKPSTGITWTRPEVEPPAAT
jgi:hypothetical protein